MSSRFSKIDDKISFPGEEENVLSYWEEIDAFQKSLELSKGRKEFTFYDGPPFATGLPHYGHILAGTIKDTVTRYAHQTGHYVSRRAGWDCHGLPVEYEIDKKLGIKDREQILEMGVKAYNSECRSIVTRYTSEWRTTVTRLGRWIDFDNDYKTMDPDFMESVWWVFKSIFDKNLVYRGYKVMPYSMQCGTPLSNFEAGLNYKDVKDPACTVTFPLIDEPDVNLIAWTTTPWTLPSNLALCVNPEFEYVKIKDKTRDDQIFIILEKRLGQIFPEVRKPDCSDETKASLYEILDRFKGTSLIGKKYKPIFPYFEQLDTAFRVCGDAYVTEEGGTGIVHQAPAFGEDDYRVCVAHKIIGKGEGIPCPLDDNGRFTSEVPEFQGQNVKDADAGICKMLKASGRLVLKETYDHSYPFCWRSDTPLIYKAVPSYFIKVEELKERLLKNNAQTYWVPQFVQEKRFHNWLAEAKDWAVSRNRFWGTPIPLWVSDDGEEVVAIGSVDELYQLSGVKVNDLHKDTIDDITIPSKQGKGELKRIEEVFDCWFESGSMPYAQLHYPFENSDRFENGFPADFIAEGLDQTRGWFYTLMVLSTALFDKPAFKNLIVNGLVLASDGKKMSKRLQNYPDPRIVTSAHGADALRLYLINSPVVRADVLKFQEKGVEDVVRTVFLPWFNAFRFFLQAIDRLKDIHGISFVPSEQRTKDTKDELDIWILAGVFGLVDYVHKEMQAYRLYTVVPRLVDFIEQFTNWYVRLNRDRLKGTKGPEEALTAMCTVYQVLVTLTQLMCPFTPFFCEYMYQHLRKFSPHYQSKDLSLAEDTFGRSDSVHFLMLPESDPSRMNELAVERFRTIQVATGLVRVARERRKIRSNYPLKEVIVVCAEEKDVEALNYLESQFIGEINAKKLNISSEWEKLCNLSCQANFATLGKKLGKNMKVVGKAIASLTHEQIASFMDTGKITLEGYDFTKDDIVVKRTFNGDTKVYEAISSDDGKIMVAIDTSSDPSIIAELNARTLAANVQKMRKNGGLVVGEAVDVFYSVEKDKDGSLATKLGQALSTHATATIQRIRTFPLPTMLQSKHAKVVYSEVFKDEDLCTSPVRITLCYPAVAINDESVESLIKSFDDMSLDMVTQYVATLNPLAVTSADTITIAGTSGVSKITLKKGVHYFNEVKDFVNASDEIRNKYGLQKLQ